MKASKKTFLVLEYGSLPKKMKLIIKEWCGFHNDCHLPLRSEFDLADFRKGMSEIDNYRTEQIASGNFKGTLKQFIKEYGLDFEVWFIEQNFDLEGVDEVAVEVSW